MNGGLRCLSHQHLFPFYYILLPKKSFYNFYIFCEEVFDRTDDLWEFTGWETPEKWNWQFRVEIGKPKIFPTSALFHLRALDLQSIHWISRFSLSIHAKSRNVTQHISYPGTSSLNMIYIKWCTIRYIYIRIIYRNFCTDILDICVYIVY